MVIELCNCPEGLGLWHSHYETKAWCKHKHTGQTFFMPKSVIDLNPNMEETIEILEWGYPGISISINWREFGESLLRDPV